jgi:hypothetical protein
MGDEIWDGMGDGTGDGEVKLWDGRLNGKSTLTLTYSALTSS